MRKMLTVHRTLQGTNEVTSHLFVQRCSFFFPLFGNPDVAKLGPGHVAFSEGTAVVTSCPKRWNLSKLRAPVLVHS